MGVERLTGNMPQGELISKTENKRNRVVENYETNGKPALVETETLEKSDFGSLRAEVLRLDPAALDSLHHMTRERVIALLA